MALLETLALTFATSLAKHMLSQWLGSSWTDEVAGDVVELLRDAAIDKAGSRTSKDEINAIADSIVRGMDQWVQVELGHIDKYEKRLIFEEFARTLVKAHIDAKMLVDFNLNSDRLRKYLMESRPEATKSLSGKATSLYDRLIKESAERIVERASEIPGLSTAFAKESLDADDKIMEALRQQSDQKDVESQDFERRYREAVVHKLDRIEIFGLPGIDSIVRRQRLSVAYVNPTLVPPSSQVQKRTSLSDVAKRKRNVSRIVRHREREFSVQMLGADRSSVSIVRTGGN